MGYQLDEQEVRDQQDSAGRQNLRNYGNFLFKDNLGQHMFVDPSSKGPIVFRAIGRPVFENGAVKDVYPALVPKTFHAVTDPAKDLYHMTVSHAVMCLSFFGPDEMTLPDPSGNLVKTKALMSSIVDDWAPDMKRKFKAEGRKIPPTCGEILASRVQAVLSQPDGARFAIFYKADNDYKAAFKFRKAVYLMQGMMTVHPSIRSASPSTPKPIIIRLGDAANFNLRDQLMTEREGYAVPAGITHDAMSERAALAARFVKHDITDPAGAPMLQLFKTKVLKQAKDGSTRYVEQYVFNVLDDQVWPYPAPYQAQTWLDLESILWYPTPREAFDCLISYASANPLWEQFLARLARNTDLLPTSVAGAMIDSEPAVVQPVTYVRPAETNVPVAGAGIPVAPAFAQHTAPAVPTSGFVPGATMPVIAGAAPAPVAPAAPAQSFVPGGAPVVPAAPAAPAQSFVPGAAPVAPAAPAYVVPGAAPAPAAVQTAVPNGQQHFGAAPAGMPAAALDTPDAVQQRTKAAMEQIAALRNAVPPSVPPQA
jgi:hypothetical protein